MSNTPHDITEEFPDQRERITKLKTSNGRFSRLADEYNELNRTIHRIETRVEPAPEDVVLEIGAGAGYQAAILAELVKQVYTMDIIEELAAPKPKTAAAQPPPHEAKLERWDSPGGSDNARAAKNGFAADRDDEKASKFYSSLRYGDFAASLPDGGSEFGTLAEWDSVLSRWNRRVLAIGALDR